MRGRHQPKPNKFWEGFWLGWVSMAAVAVFIVWAIEKLL